jgi:hypothetical protein
MAKPHRLSKSICECLLGVKGLDPNKWLKNMIKKRAIPWSGHLPFTMNCPFKNNLMIIRRRYSYCARKKPHARSKGYATLFLRLAGRFQQKEKSLFSSLAAFNPTLLLFSRNVRDFFPPPSAVI